MSKHEEPRPEKPAEDDAAAVKRLVMHAVYPVLQNCGNSYANAYTEQWLRKAKEIGAYHGEVIGDIADLLEGWQDWLDKNDGLPEIDA
jgi:hypothetical protein